MPQKLSEEEQNRTRKKEGWYRFMEGLVFGIIIGIVLGYLFYA